MGREKDGILCSINSEMMELYNYLEKHDVTGAEASLLLQPLILAVEGDKATPKATLCQGVRRRVEGLTRQHLLWVVSFGVVALIFALLQIPNVANFMPIIGRQLLLVVLPYWDWSKLYYSDCLVTNPFYINQKLTTTDCNICESLESVESLTRVTVSEATEEYLRNDRPFVVTDAMESWPVMTTDNFWFDNVTEMYRSEELRHIYPCELTSNLRLRPDDLQTFIKRIHSSSVERWFGHWENCNKVTAKALRSLYQRPYFMPHMIDFSDTNWVLMSSDYRAKVYKEMKFQSEVLWFGVLRGWWHVRLVPREPCDEHCPELTVTVMEGHILVVTNLLWKLEYIPGEDTDNLAIAVGGFWN